MGRVSPGRPLRFSAEELPLLDEHGADERSGIVGPPGAAATMHIDSAGSNFDAVLSVFHGSCGSSSETACADDTNGRLESTTFQVTPGQAYLVQATTWNSAEPGTLNLNFTFDADPVPTATMTRTPTISPTPTGAVCAAEPRQDCASAAKGLVKIAADSTDLAKRKLAWKWSNGNAGVADFGNPADDTSLRLCVYDDQRLAVDAAINAGGLCGSKPCWVGSAKGFAYKSSMPNASGISSVNLKFGAGTAGIQVKGKGLPLMSPFPITDATAVTVQLVRSPGGSVSGWQSVFPSPAGGNDGEQFKDKIP